MKSHFVGECEAFMVGLARVKVLPLEGSAGENLSGLLTAPTSIVI